MTEYVALDCRVLDAQLEHLIEVANRLNAAHAELEARVGVLEGRQPIEPPHVLDEYGDRLTDEYGNQLTDPGGSDGR